MFRIVTTMVRKTSRLTFRSVLLGRMMVICMNMLGIYLAIPKGCVWERGIPDVVDIEFVHFLRIYMSDMWLEEIDSGWLLTFGSWDCRQITITFPPSPVYVWNVTQKGYSMCTMCTGHLFESSTRSSHQYELERLIYHSSTFRFLHPLNHQFPQFISHIPSFCFQHFNMFSVQRAVHPWWFTPGRGLHCESLGRSDGVGDDLQQ